MMRPLVRLSAVISIDGKLYPEGQPGHKIGSALDRERLLSLRRESDAVLIGRKTLLIDNDAKIADNAEIPRRNPLNAVCASRLEFDHQLPFFKNDAVSRVIFTTALSREEDRQRFSAWADIVVTRSDEGRVDIVEVLDNLHHRGIRNLLLEGGGTLNHSFVRRGLVDELHLTLAAVVLAGERNASVFQGSPLPFEMARQFDLADVERHGPELFLVYHRIQEG